MAQAMIMRRGGSGGNLGVPEFEYTGSYSLLDDNDGNWRILFLTSGVLTLTSQTSIDLFLVGGGGGGGKASTGTAGGGAGGGYTRTHSGIVLQPSPASYSIVVGAGGEKSSDGLTGGKTWAIVENLYYANGGNGGIYKGAGGNGGSGGGAGGGLGATNGGSASGTGQGTTTKEFAESTGTLYASGGRSGSPSSKLANTGNGGDGGNVADGSGTAGASGIVVIRNHRVA